MTKPTKTQDVLPWSIRDDFAVAAMQGMIAASGDSYGIYDFYDIVVAKSAYKVADKMIKERSK